MATETDEIHVLSNKVSVLFCSVLQMAMKILILIFIFEIKESKITRGFTLVKKQSRLDVRKFSFSQRTINVWNTLSEECVHANSVKPGYIEFGVV